MTYYGTIDHEALRQELVKVLPENNWYLTGATGEVTFNSTDLVNEEKAKTIIEQHITDAPLRVQNKIILDLTKALEDFYDSKAKEKKYDNRLTCTLRAGYAGPFQSEGISFAIWMDNCNAYAYQVMQDVLAEEREIPTSEELIVELPILEW